MADKEQVASQTSIIVDGEILSEEISGQLLEITVDQNVYLPAMFVIRLYDPGTKLLDGDHFDLARAIEIRSKTANGTVIKLIDGEITSLEPGFGEGMIAELTVRGYDKSHRLYREKKSKSYLNVKDSDLAKQIANHVNLTAQVDTTATVYEHIYQHNQSDLEFLRSRAQRIGYECFVSGKNLIFRKPTSRKIEVTAAWGVDLVQFHPRISLAEQVEEVWVKGWDVQKKAAIIGRSGKGDLYPSLAKNTDAKGWAQTLNGSSRMVVVAESVVSQAEADIVATALMDELSGAFVEAEGQAFRRPDIVAGVTIKIDGLGKKLSGKYLVTSATHIYNDAGLMTNFAVTGLRNGLLSEQFANHNGATRWPGVVSAIVTNADDPENLGRVKVKYPWLSEQEESNWVRVMGIGAGPDCGLSAVPDIDDEVLVAFQHGDFNSPILLGGVWNGQDGLPSQTAGAPPGETPLVRSWTSRTGHRITTYDNADNKIEIETSGKHAITLDDAGKKITIKSAGGLELQMDDNGRKILVKSDGDVEVTAATGLTMKGLNVKIEASANLDLQASGQVNVKGAMINLG